MNTTTRASLIAAAIALLPGVAAASCGSAFCAVNTNWTAESAQVDAPSSWDLRYEHINQDQPQTGTDRIGVGQIPHHHDEVSTANRNLVATYSRNLGAGFGVTVSAAISDRDHLHVHNHHGAQLPEQWTYTELGDVRVTGRYQLPYVGDPMAPANTGLIFGLKLPTGRTNVANAAGSVAERSLQPGTGTTDLILGAYYHQKLPQRDASWFAQVQVQQALNSHDDYRPGTQLGIDLGYRHGLTDKLGGLVQLNTVVKRSDSGAQAEPEDSGSRAVFLSPGLAYALTDNTQVYGFYQHPLYQNVNGVQLTARRAIVVGLSGRF
ncbi:transporter [Oxalobacteraceae bacterium OM1]|nr:transporter [Oxalobacteraceae bacterium OM1]